MIQYTIRVVALSARTQLVSRVIDTTAGIEKTYSLFSPVSMNAMGPKAQTVVSVPMRMGYMICSTP